MEVLEKDSDYLVRIKYIGDIWASGPNIEIEEQMLIIKNYTIKRKYGTYRNAGKNIDVCYGQHVSFQVAFPISSVIGVTLLGKNKRPLWAREKSVAITLPVIQPNLLEKVMWLVLITGCLSRLLRTN